jgi:mRNA-binding protein PUF3
MKPPLRLGNGFTANSNPWDGSGSIWGSSSNPATFVDGAADLELRSGKRERYFVSPVPTNVISGSVSHSNGGTHHFRGRVSSGSLLSSSESDCWNGQPNFPWNTATNGTSFAVSRPQGQALSAVHLRNGEYKTSMADPQLNGRDPSSLFPIDQYSHFDASNYTPQDPSRQSTSVSQSRNMTSNKFLHFNVDHKEEETRRNTNNASFRANSSAISTPSSLRFLNSKTESPSLLHGKVRPNNAPTKSRNNFDLPDMLSGLSRPPYPSDLSYNSTSHPSHHPSASTHRSFSGVQDRALQYDRLEDQLAARFHNMDLQAETMSQDLASRFQPQGHLQRAPHNLDRSFEAGLSRPVSHKGSEDMGLAGTFPASSDGMAETGYPFSGDYYRSTSFGERGSSSPTASDYRRGLSTPLYSTNGGTPPTRPESVRSASGSGFSNHASNSQLVLLDRESRASRPSSSEEQYTMSSAPQARMQYNQPYEIGGYHSPLRLNPLALPYPLPPYHGLTNSYPSRYPNRENDASQIVRSPLLEDFRANHKTSKRYELKVSPFHQL